MMVTPKAVCSTVACAGAAGCGGGPPNGAATTIMRGSLLGAPSGNPPTSPSATGVPKPPANDPEPQPPCHEPKGKGCAMNGLDKVKVGEKKGLAAKKNGEPKTMRL